MAVALVHTNESLAKENVKLLPARLSQVRSLVLPDLIWADRIQRVEIRSDGRLVLAKIYGRIARSWLEFMIRRDPLLLHE